MEWEQVGKEELEKLYYDNDYTDNQIAQMFHITKGKVTYRRRKYNISMLQKAIRDGKVSQNQPESSVS